MKTRFLLIPLVSATVWANGTLSVVHSSAGSLASSPSLKGAPIDPRAGDAGVRDAIRLQEQVQQGLDRNLAPMKDIGNQILAFPPTSELEKWKARIAQLKNTRLIYGEVSWIFFVLILKSWALRKTGSFVGRWGVRLLCLLLLVVGVVVGVPWVVFGYH